MGGTVAALMARGVDKETAEKVRRAGYTLQKLKLEKKSKLISLGILETAADNILKEQRPPIPIETLTKVLFDNRFMCCVCRDSKKSVIVHHIDEWAKSRSHNIENLAVLCLEHHDEAHSRKALSQNLDGKTIRELKFKWESEVKEFDARSILDAMALEYASWNYINEVRVFELAIQNGIDPRTTNKFNYLVSIGVAQPDGFPASVAEDGKYYKYQGANIQYRYFFTSQILNAVIGKLPIINISDHLDKGSLSTSIVKGDFVFVQGKHVFLPVTKKKDGTGSGHICEGVRAANNVEVRFTFDRWEATSSSARACWLTGTRDQGSLVHVKDVSREGQKLVIRGTILGICSNNGDLKNRDYATTLWESGSFKSPYADMIDEEDLDEDEDEALI